MNRFCPGCRAGADDVVRDGSYFRASDSRHIQRFRCRRCTKRFSSATFSPNFAQKKRRINPQVEQCLASAVSIRRTALLVGVDRKTVARRLSLLAAKARERHARFLARWIEENGPVTTVQFDELHTLEHTKCKPLSVCVVVEAAQRLILGLGVAAIPASGPLAAVSRQKYGPRPDQSGVMRAQLFADLERYIDPQAHFASDEHQRYPELVKSHFPNATHARFPSVRARGQGQGELKAIGHDPLFTINHTLAMLRANVNRLIRRSWCTTKRPERLDDHLWIYTDFHNRVLLGCGSRSDTSAH